MGRSAVRRIGRLGGGLATTAAPLIATAVLLVLPGTASAATFTVDTTADTGPGSLRQALTDALANTEADAIEITATGAIELVTALPTIDSDEITITGPGADQLDVTRAESAGDFRIFTITGADSDVEIARITISGGKVSGILGAQGGGIRLDDASLTLTGVVVADNLAATATGLESSHARGGGVYNEAGTLTVTASTIATNVADATAELDPRADGGGIELSSGATLTIESSTVSGNVARATGPLGLALGGGLAGGLGATATIRSATFAGNEVSGEDIARGASVFANTSATTTLQNTILAGPVGATNCAGSDTITSADHNLADDVSCGLTQPADQPDTDPLLAPLGDNGGPTPTHAISTASPAYDQGFSDGITQDQRAAPRPYEDPALANAPGGDGADVGAYELQPPPPGTGKPTPRRCRDATPTIRGTPGDDELTGTPGDDVIKAGGGDDRIRALGGDDLVCAGRGEDTAFGGGGEDVLRGGRGADELAGRGADDLLVGYFGDDLLRGGGGRDGCRGGRGADVRRACEGR